MASTTTAEPVAAAAPGDAAPKDTSKDAPRKHMPMPSLDQLAARVAVSGGSGGSAAASQAQAARPRLATSILARSSGAVSTLSAVAPSADSLAANPPPAQRAPSPASTSPAPSRPESPSGEDAVVEKLDRLDLTDKEKKIARGYKNVPTLEAITERFKAQRLASAVDEKPPALPAAVPKKDEHPLQNRWILYHDTKAKYQPPTNPDGTPAPYQPPSTESGAYEAGLTVIGEFATVETFCRYFNWLKPPSKLERNSNYHLFKKGIKPMWEDPANKNGGRWVLTMRNTPQLLDRCWSWLVFALVGEEFDEGEELCGAVVSLRSKQDRIQVWIRSKDDVERINSIGRKLVKILDVSEADGIGLEFQYNTDDRPPQNRFLSISAPYPQSSFRSSFQNGPGQNSNPDSPNLNTGFAPQAHATGPAVGHHAPMGAFGAFGGGWRGKPRAAGGRDE